MIVIKYTLLLIIFITSTSIGILLSKRSVHRVIELKEFKKTINMIENKMKFTYEPLGEIFYDIHINSNGTISEIYKDASELIKTMSTKQAWNQAIKQNEEKLYIDTEDKNTILNLGKMLGTTDIEGQVSELELTLSFIDIQISKAEEEKKKNEKLYKSLGSIIGLTIVIILI